MSHKMGTSMSTAVGLTDYGFLYASTSARFGSTVKVKSRHSGIGEADEDVRPSIDDFDSEIAIFKVHTMEPIITGNCMLYNSTDWKFQS